MNLKNLFRPAPTPITLIFERSCFVGGEHYEVGESASFDPKTAREIIGSGAAADPEADAAAVAKTASLAALLPPPVEPEPIPENFAELPSCFADWWKLNAARNALQSRRDAIEERLMQWYVKRSPEFSRALNSLPPHESARLFRTFNFEINNELPAELEKQRYLKDAMARADRNLADWNADNLTALLKSQLECSTFTQVEHGQLCRSIKELHAKGMELFSIRLSALGLHQSQVERLYTGSTDYQKYGTIAVPTLQDLKLAWSEPGQDPVCYIAQSPRTLASVIAGYSATIDKVNELTRQADKELAATRKVTSKAA